MSHQAAMLTDLLRNTDLLNGIDAEKHSAVLSCLSARFRSFKDGQSISSHNDKKHTLHVVLSGTALLVRHDLRGNRAILAELEPGALVDLSTLKQDLILGDTELVARNLCRTVQFLIPDSNRRNAGCSKHIDKVDENVRVMILTTNANLVRRIRVLTGRSIRERLLLFLQEKRRVSGADFFTIPYNRQELADLLNADRSALSRELGLMEADGLITFEGNRFSLNDSSALGSSNYDMLS